MASFPAFSSSDTPYSLLAGHCDICRTTPLNALPFEEEEGYPHYPTLDALEESAKTCVMCALLYWAAGCSIVNYGGMASFKYITLPSGVRQSTRALQSISNGLGIRAFENGAITIDRSGPLADPRPPIQADLKRTFPSGVVTKNGETKPIRPYLFVNWYKSGFVGREGLLMVGLGIRLGTSGKIEDSVDRDRDTINIRGSYLRFRTDKETYFIPGRIRASNSGSAFAFGKVKDWLNVCDKKHDCIDVDVQERLPTRVLDCSSENQDMVFLRYTAGQKGRYLAVSHCWGSAHRLTLTRANIAVLKDGVLISELPKTFQDSVKIARELNIPYLWIDSLCIIQDDATDWEHEASRMGDVYAGAYLTVAALSSKDDSSGCFPDATKRYDELFVSSDVRSTGRRSFFLAAPVAEYQDDEITPTLMGRCHWATDEVTNSNTGGSHIAWLYMTPEWMPPSLKDKPKQYIIGEFGGEFDPISDEPLSERGWTLQERILSRRTIHYGRTEMYWECQRYVFAEDGAAFRRTFTQASDLWASEPREPGKTRNWRWARLVEEYSKRKLTNGFDKLPALSGLANLIAEKTGDTYLAGLWKSNLLSELNWGVKAFEPTHHCHDPAHDASMPPARKSAVKYPTEYRAPSWSWASVDAEIDYIGASLGGGLATCVDVQVKPLGKDAFGRVASSSLLLKGPLYQLSPRELKGRDAVVFPLHTGVTATWSGGLTGFFGKKKEMVTKEGMVLFDADATFPSVALFLGATHALVLRETRDGKYVRIGTAEFHLAEVGVADKTDLPNGAVTEVVII